MMLINTAKKLIVTKMAGVAVAAFCWSLCAPAEGQPPSSYKLVDLGVAGPAGQPFHITNNGIISAAVAAQDGADHAVIYLPQHPQPMIDISQSPPPIDVSQPGLGGANSEAIGVNGKGTVVGGANTPNVDPHGEDFCGFQTQGIPSATQSCLPFLWENGTMTVLPILGGNNGIANSVNQVGEVAGAAENTTLEPTCAPYNPASLQFQQYQFKPVVWRQQAIQELPTLGGDPVGWAKVINSQGQAVGATGTCAVFSFLLGFPMQPLHAVLWEKDGSPTDLGSLGGNQQSLWGNVAEGLNNSGHVVGSSSLSDNVTFHAFFWSRESGGMQDLGAVPGVPNSFAIAINDSDDIVGVSTDLATQFVATIWKHGVATDLNTLIPANSSLYLLSGCWINSRGEIIGLAIDGGGSLHGYELIPNDDASQQ